MSIFIECQEGQQGKNTGALDQCLEALTVRHVLAPIGQSFATKTIAKTLAAWKAGIASKDLIPLYDAENLAVADVAPTYEETRKEKLLVAKGKKVRTFEFKLGLCSHAALASYNNKKMMVYEITEENELLAVSKDGVTVTGQSVMLDIGMRVSTTKDKKAHTVVTLSYLDYTELERDGQLLVLPFYESDIMGIFDSQVSQVSASVTSVKFQILAGCQGMAVTSFVDTDFAFLTAAGTPVTHTFVAAGADGTYEFKGTGFVSGSTIALKGVATTPEASYETVAPLAIIVT